MTQVIKTFTRAVAVFLLASFVAWPAFAEEEWDVWPGAWADAQVVFVTYSAARIVVESDKGYYANVDFGPTTARGNISSDRWMLLAKHFLDLKDLAPDTGYHYRVTLHDEVGTVVESAYGYFRTVPYQPIIETEPTI